MISERILLQTIKFDLQLSHPYEFLIKYGKALKGIVSMYTVENSCSKSTLTHFNPMCHFHTP